MRSQPLPPSAWSAVPFIMLSLIFGLSGGLGLAVTFPAGYALLDSAEKQMKKQPEVFTGRRALKILFVALWISAALFVLSYAEMLIAGEMRK